MLLMSGAFALLSSVRDSATLAVAAFVYGLGNGMCGGILNAFATSLTPPEARTQFLGLWKTVTALGGVSLPPLFGTVSDATSLDIADPFLSAAALIAVAWMLLMVVGRSCSKPHVVNMDSLPEISELAKHVEVPPPDPPGDLACAQCESLLLEPTTLEDGETVCRFCVRKRRAATAEMQVEQPPWAKSAEQIGFGSDVNVILAELAAFFCPAAQRSATARQRGNALFGESKFSEAIVAYTEALDAAPSPDLVLFCNRALAHLKNEDPEPALRDALSGAAASPGSGPCLFAKAWFRLGQALLAQGEAPEASFALARAASAPGVATALAEACGRLSAEDVEKVKDWLRQGHCPSIETRLPSIERGGRLSVVGEGSKDWLRNQLECPLCLGLLCQPSSLPCGHTLCRTCLARTLDHAFDAPPACPMCRKDLSSYLTWLNGRALIAGRLGVAAGHGGAQIPINQKIAAIIDRHFPAEVAERALQIASAETAGGEGGEHPVVPIFICSMAMPSVACPLHIFEPRYRLMMRRCIDSGQRQFGMCLFPGAEFGTMLYIQSFRQLPDGRSQIKTIGARRFQVLEWGEKDGYATGRVRWLEDEEPDPVAAEPATEEVSTPTAKQARVMLHRSALRLRKAVDGLLAKAAPSLEDLEGLEQQLGPKPCTEGSDGPCCPGFVFWCMGLAHLPPRLCYELCFGKEYRQSAEKRLQAVLDIYEKQIRMAKKKFEQEEDSDSNQDVVRWLLGADVDKGFKYCYGAMTAMISAADKGHVDVVRLLLEANMDKQLQDAASQKELRCYGDTALINACHKGHLEVVRLLLDSGVDADVRDYDDRTALMHAAENGRTDIVRLLLKAGANRGLKSSYLNQTAQSCAADCGHDGILELLEDTEGESATKSPLSGYGLFIENTVYNLKRGIRMPSSSAVRAK
eukprot:s317_g19.t1